MEQPVARLAVGRRKRRLARRKRKQMQEFCTVKAQDGRQPHECLGGHADVAPLFEPGIPADAHPGEQRHFFATQSWRAPPPARQAQLFGLQTSAPSGQESAKLRSFL